MQKLLSLIVTLVFACQAQAQSSNCKDEQYQAFDFWLGHWQVSSKSSANISHNTITKINDGCGLLEEYTTPTGFKGKSLNIYNKQDKLWHQTWIDNSGLLLQLKGQLVDGKMVMEGHTIDAQGKSLLNRITWQQQKDERVRQHWQVSKDQGKSWQTLFDGLYQRVKP